MPTDLTQLEALARAATPGEWVIYKATPWQVHDKDKLVAEARHSNNATYIAAANPAAILALIERVRVAEGALPEQPSRQTAEERYADIERAKRDSIRRVLKAGTWP